MYFIRKIIGRFWPLFILTCMLFVFLSVATKEDNLNVYNGNHSEYTVEPETETEKKIITNTYMNAEIDLSMQIPDGWQHIIKDGFDTYVHSPSASSVQIQVMSYYPMVNNATAESLSDTYSARGLEITEFQYTADNSYYVIYRSKGISGITDYIECVLWDRQNVAKVIFTFNDDNFERIQDEIWYCIDSISWNYEDPIAEGFYLKYQLAGDFEFAVPDNWTVADTGTSFYAYEENTGASMTVNLLEDSTLLTEITQVDYADFLSNGKSDFILNTFQQSDNMIYGEATYSYNGTTYAVIQTYYANGTYQYILTYEFPVELGETYAAASQNALNMTRIFFNPNEQTEKADKGTESIQQNNDSIIFTPDGLPQKQDSTTEQTVPEKQPENQEASTFSEALIQITGISKESADKIVSLWTSLNLGNPSFAEVVEENDSSLVFFVTNDQSVNYYIYMGLNGEVQQITVNEADGKIIFSSK